MASTSKGCSDENEKKPLISTNSSSSTDEDDNNPLNCASKKFDPLTTLYSDEVKSKKSYKQYDNLAHFESALKRAGIEFVGSKKHVSENPNSTNEKKKEIFNIDYSERRFLPHQMPVQGGPVIKPKHNRNMFKYMEEVKGPLSVLKKKYIDNNQEIHVYTRKEHGVRGVVTGNLIVFDKHWNLLLVNVCETWQRRKYAFSQNNCTVSIEAQDCSERLKNLRITLPETKVRSLNRKYVEITRYYKQIMIRGEQIVLICEKHLNEKEKKR